MSDVSTAVALTRMRRAIARATSESARIPQFTLEWDVGFVPLTELRDELAAAGLRLSYVDFLVAACAHTLREHPFVNASFGEEEILQHAEINIGIAVALDEGLIAPAILGSDRLTLPELAVERARLAEAAVAGKLGAADVLSTTFTISNLGPYGVHRFRALVVPPQAAILAIGARCDGAASLSLSCDHRVLDGAPAAEFLRDLVSRIEQPSWLRPLAAKP